MAIDSFIVNAAAPQPLPDKAFQIATNPTANNITPQSAKLLITGFGLSQLRTLVYRRNIGEDLRTGELARPYVGTDNLDGQDMGSLTITDAPNGGAFVFSELSFEAKKFKDPYVRGSAQKTFPGFTLDVALMTVSQTKNIVKTEVQGRPGTVKEFTSMGDFVINLKGAIVGRGHYDYPSERVRTLLDLLNVPDSLEVVSPYLNDLFDITDVVVESYDLPQREGFQNLQLVNINLLSDLPVVARQVPRGAPESA